MYKQILTFLGIFLLGACATMSPQTARESVPLTKPVSFFVEDKAQVAFKVTGQMDEMKTDGVLTIRKTEEDAYAVTLLMGGLYRVLDAAVSPQEITYYYLFKDVDNGLVRGRITQLLDLLLTPPQHYTGTVMKDGFKQVRYKGPRAKEIFFYEEGQAYPVSARTVTALNSAELTYGDYMPVSADGETRIPHELVYKDGKITLELQLISLR